MKIISAITGTPSTSKEEVDAFLAEVNNNLQLSNRLREYLIKIRHGIRD